MLACNCSIVMSTVNVIDFKRFNITCETTMDACFTAFDKNCDGNLNYDEFQTFCCALFRNTNGETYSMKQKMVYDIFNVFDVNKDGGIDQNEFADCWHRWIKTIVRPVSALLIIDVQNDFIEGSLSVSKCSAKHNGFEVLPPINHLLDTVPFDAVYYSLDWHPNDHVSFFDNLPLRKLHPSSPFTLETAKMFDTVIFDRVPPMPQKLWPRHCVQNTWGSELHKNLKVIENSIKMYKGTNPEVDSYSLFWDNLRLSETRLDSFLKQKNVTDLYVCGLAYDICVAYTVKDAISAGYRSVLLDDCCRGVDLLDIEKIKNFLVENNGLVVDSNRVENMVNGNDRRPELGYKLAMEIKRSRQ